MAKERSNVKKTDLYGNCEVYSPDGELLFLCLPKKANWYLRKTDDYTGMALGVKMPDRGDGVLRVQLTFEPKGKGNSNDPYSLSKKENRCVVCGTEEDLTKHHIVPHEYRRFMPEEYKSRNSHDVVPICIDHHYEYEANYADKLKMKLSEEYGAPLNGDIYVDKELRRAAGAARALNRHGAYMPLEKVFHLQSIIESFFKVEHVEAKHIEQLVELESDTKTVIARHGEIIMNNIEDLQGFVEMWREDFLNSMNPGFMPKYWDVKRPAKRLG
jgi:hypothetical protein